MEIKYSYNPQVKKIVLSSTAKFGNETLPVQKYLTINPFKKTVINETLWCLDDKFHDNFKDHDELMDFRKSIDIEMEAQASLDQYTLLDEVQALINQHFKPMGDEDFEKLDLSDNAKKVLKSILESTKMINVLIISKYGSDNLYHVNYLWLMDGQTHIGFSSTIDQNGNYDEFYPTRSSSLDISPERIEEHPEDYYEWLGDGKSAEEIQDIKDACKWMLMNMPELFMIRSEKRIFF